MTDEHASEDRRGTLLGLRVRAPQADEPFRAVLTGRQRAEMPAHVPQVAADGKRRPLFRGGIAETVVAVKRVLQATDRLPVLLDQRGGIELGVHHDRVEGRMSEERLDDVHGHVVVQMLGRKDAATVVRQEHE